MGHQGGANQSRIIRNSCQIDVFAAGSQMRFSLRHMFVAITLIALLTGSCVLIRNHLDRIDGHGPYESFEEWPHALKMLLKDDVELRSDVEPFGLMQFIDHQSIWRISANSELRSLLEKNHQLELVGKNHVMVKELLESIPADWDAPNLNNCNWYATPGHGTVHIEGLDLFLILDDLDSGESIVLHEWIF